MKPLMTSLVQSSAPPPGILYLMMQSWHHAVYRQGQWWHNHSAGQGQDAFMAMWLWGQNLNACSMWWGSTPAGHIYGHNLMHTNRSVFCFYVAIRKIFFFLPSNKKIMLANKPLCTILYIQESKYKSIQTLIVGCRGFRWNLIFAT